MRILSGFFVLLVWLSATVAEAQTPQPGDVIFHRSRSAQSRIIQQVTSSPWTHVGVVFEREGALHVLEAVQPVRWTPLEEWVARGRGGEFTIRRRRAPLDAQELDTLREAGERFLGLPYDARFEWNERRIYCSELVWLMFEEALGLRLSEPQTWSALSLSPAARRLARRRLGRLPPADALIVTPVALLDSPALFDPAVPEE